MTTTSAQIRKFERHEIQLLWYADFWDGPINGLCLCDGNKCWFELLTAAEHDLPDTTQRRFLLLELSPHQLAEAEGWHDLFRQKVGTHCDFEEPHPEVKPADSHREFYEAYHHRPKVDYSNNSALGWFEMT